MYVQSDKTVYISTLLSISFDHYGYHEAVIVQ